VDDLKLSRDERDTALAAVRAHQDNIRRMTDVAGESLLLKLKGILSPEEYKKLQAATAAARDATRGGRRLTADDIADRILSFDKNKTGKVTKEDLPERMQFLIERGDTNKDGALDRDEIKKLAAELARDGTFPGTGPGGRGGFGGRGGPGGPGGSTGGLSFAMIERAVDDLKLADGKKESAAADVKAHKKDARKLTELARAEVLLQMCDLLSEAEFKTFKAALEREPGVGDRPAVRDQPPPGRGGPTDRGGPGGRGGPPGRGGPDRPRPPRP
jgi:hypothetical protein